MFFILYKKLTVNIFYPDLPPTAVVVPPGKCTRQPIIFLSKPHVIKLLMGWSQIQVQPVTSRWCDWKIFFVILILRIVNSDFFNIFTGRWDLVKNFLIQFKINIYLNYKKKNNLASAPWYPGLPIPVQVVNKNIPIIEWNCQQIFGVANSYTIRLKTNVL